MAQIGHKEYAAHGLRKNAAKAGCTIQKIMAITGLCQDIVITANLTPRKCLGFKTPFQAILKELGKDVQIRFT